jgi:hypothetical protein
MTVQFHQVDLPAGGPAAFYAEGPDGGPGPQGGVDAGANQQGAVLKVERTPGFEAGGGPGGYGTVLAPVLARGVVAGVDRLLPAGFEAEQPVFRLHGILGLVPLVFVVPHEAVLRYPDGGVYGAGGIEFGGEEELAVGEFGIGGGRRGR